MAPSNTDSPLLISPVITAVRVSVRYCENCGTLPLPPAPAPSSPQNELIAPTDSFQDRVAKKSGEVNSENFSLKKVGGKVNRPSSTSLFPSRHKTAGGINTKMTMTEHGMTKSKSKPKSKEGLVEAEAEPELDKNDNDNDATTSNQTTELIELEKSLYEPGHDHDHIFVTTIHLPHSNKSKNFSAAHNHNASFTLEHGRGGGFPLHGQGQPYGRGHHGQHQHQPKRLAAPSPDDNRRGDGGNGWAPDGSIYPSSDRFPNFQSPSSSSSSSSSSLSSSYNKNNHNNNNHNNNNNNYNNNNNNNWGERNIPFGSPSISNGENGPGDMYLTTPHLSNPHHVNGNERNGSTTGPGVIVRGEEVGIVVFVLLLWVAAIALFFNRWGKIRMLEPYQPKFCESHRPSCPMAEVSTVQQYPARSRTYSKFNISTELIGSPHFLKCNYHGVGGSGYTGLGPGIMGRPRQNSVFVTSPHSPAVMAINSSVLKNASRKTKSAIDLSTLVLSEEFLENDEDEEESDSETKEKEEKEDAL